MSNEQVNPEDSGIIDSVPGTEKKANRDGIHVGQVVLIPDSAFKGDPRRVIGHPSNPKSNMNLDGLFPPSDSDKTSQTPKSEPHPDLITQVPLQMETPEDSKN